ncbi:SGNH/GDSL hydrolase family protein [Pseudoroseomonas sp. WGS1072]|uniref:SGNH/GDSL hydrolase family protein n=1 Tax=Roseomonas sp. WGS1072 TaxID=3366816 RepID=UPI003BEF9AE8
MEYPSGHFYQLTFAGQLSAYLQDGAERLSDPLPVSIPAGARFWEWTYYEGTTGVLFCMTNNQVDAAILGEPVPPRWPVPGMAPSSRVYGATAIIGVTDRPAILLLGDSRAAGTMGGSIGNDGGNVLPSISRDFAFINAAVPGETLWQALTAANHRRSLARFCSHVVISGGVNDLMGTDAQQVIETVTRLVATFPLPVFLVTVEPFSSGGFQAADGGDQVINPIFEARRRLYNQAVRDGIPGAAGYFDIASLAELPGHPGKWRPGLTEDGLHGNGEFARHVVSSRVISAEVFRR